MQLTKKQLYFSMFKITFSVSAFTFGGGYVVIPMMRTHFVEDLNLITEEELLDMAAIAQSTPGAIAVNLAVLIGYRLGGILGAIVNAIGTILPPIIILAVISKGYEAFRDNRIINAVLKGMEAGVVALIVNLVIDMLQVILERKNLFLTLMVPVAFVASFILQINVAVIIICSALISLLNTAVVMHKKRRTSC